MSKGEGLYFENGRGHKLITGSWVRGQTRGNGAPLTKVGVLAYRRGAFWIDPITSGSIQIGTVPGQVHPGSVVAG